MVIFYKTLSCLLLQLFVLYLGWDCYPQGFLFPLDLTNQYPSFWGSQISEAFRPYFSSSSLLTLQTVFTVQCFCATVEMLIRREFDIAICAARRAAQMGQDKLKPAFHRRSNS